MVFPQNPNQAHVQGRFNTALLEINIYTDGSKQDNALQLVRQIKDAMVYALSNAGQYDAGSDSILFPPIVLNDANGASTNTFVRPMTELPNWVIKNFYKPSAPETQIFRYQLIIKLEWVELT